MAAPARIFTANLGSQTIALAEFRPLPQGGLMLRQYMRRELVIDNPNDPRRHIEITDALQEMSAELRVKHSPVNYAVPAQSVFVRFVRLPVVETEKIERIVAFEAQQNVPFPIEEVVWDYQLVGGGAGEQFQVVLVAIKADLLESMNAAVEAAGLRPRVVSLTTTALYNAFRYNYSDIAAPSLLIDIGARTTNLLFIEPGRIFTRCVPVGGATITSAVAKEFEESFAAAESRKRTAGFVSLGGAAPEPADPVTGRMSKTIRTTMTRLHAEIMRSISHYRSQQQGNPPERIYLCGGSAGMAYTREFFAEKLQLPIEFFNPLRKVAVAAEANQKEISAASHHLGELVGLALRSILACPMELNLRPASVVRRHDIQRRRPFLVTAAACLILAVLGWSVFYFHAADVLRESKQQIDEKVAKLRGLQTQIDKVRKDAGGLDSFAAPLLEAINSRSFWPQLLEDLNARLPKENIWITELIPLSGGRPVTPDNVQLPSVSPGEPSATVAPQLPRRAAAGKTAIDGLLIRGLYLWNPRQQEVVVDYFKNLVRSPFFAVDPNNQQRVIKPTMPTNTEWAFPYELQLDFKQPLPLP